MKLIIKYYYILHQSIYLIINALFLFLSFFFLFNIFISIYRQFQKSALSYIPSPTSLPIGPSKDITYTLLNGREIRINNRNTSNIVIENELNNYSSTFIITNIILEERVYYYEFTIVDISNNNNNGFINRSISSSTLPEDGFSYGWFNTSTLYLYIYIYKLYFFVFVFLYFCILFLL